MTTRLYQREVTVQSVAINAHDCPSCGVIYGLADDYEQRRRQDGATWYCPNGHSVSYNGTHEAELKKARAEVEAAKERLEAEQGWSARLSTSLENERKQHASTKGQLTKTRKRIQGGVCPDCNRHFENVERHMQTKHKALMPMT
jgi:uncharacterized protein with PIN domain